MRICSVEHLGHEAACVWRVRVDGWTSPAASLVVKVQRTASSVGHGGPAHARRERLALAALGSLGVAPRLLCADAEHGITVMEDAGSTTLLSVLLGDDPTAAALSMVDLARTVGALHAGTADRVATLPTALHEARWVWLGAERWDLLCAATERLALPPASIVSEEMAAVVRALDRRQHDVLVHVDIHPENAVVTAEGVRLIDFEGAGVRHAGVDACSFVFPFPCYSPHWSTLPAALTDECLAAYRSTLVEGVRWADDDTAFTTMLVHGSAALLAVRMQRLDRIAADGQTPDESWRRRTQLAQQIDRFVALAGPTGLLPRFVDWSRELVAAMQARWADCGDPPAPSFPAFAGVVDRC